jgi:sortase A
MKTMDWGVRGLQRLLLIVGICLLAIYAGARFHGAILSRLALWRFQTETAAAAGKKPGPNALPAGQDGRVDYSLWSPKRVAAYQQALLAEFEAPLGVLSIARLGLEVPVFAGTDDLTLNRGAGWIAGTARPGEAGNIGIAAHRDGFFRVLKDIRDGDQIALDTPQHKAVYQVDQIEIVAPDDVHVLQPRPQPSLTLVTCYPFYFVGDAPQRYIVHAVRVDAEGDAAAQRALPNSKTPLSVKQTQ